MDRSELNILIKARNDASRVLNDINGDIKKLSRDGHHHFDGLRHAAATATKALATGAVVLGGALVALGVSSVKAYNEAEQAQTQLRHAVVEVSKATHEQLIETEKLADALQQRGVLDADNIKVGLAQLSTFGLSNKAVQALGGSLADLAVNQHGVNASGEQLSDTANMIAKALNGQFGVLEKSGIRFTDAQKHVIEFGTEMEKVTAINEGFAQNLKFTNDVALTTTSGKLAKLRVGFEDIKESIGGAIVEAITPLIGQLSTFVSSDQFQAWVENLTKWLSDNLPKAIAWLRDEGLPAIKNAFDLLWPVVQKAWEMFSGLVTFLKNNEPVFWAMVAVFGAIKVAMMLSGALAAFQAVIGGAAASYGGLAALIASPLVMPAIAVAAALAALALVYNAARETERAVQGAERAAANLKTSNSAVRARLQAGLLSNDPGVRDRSQRALDAGIGLAKGTDFWRGGPTWVGEEGPEIVNLPRGSQVIPNNEAGRGGSTINFYGNFMFPDQQAEDRFIEKLNRQTQKVEMGLL